MFPGLHVDVAANRRYVKFPLIAESVVKTLTPNFKPADKHFGRSALEAVLAVDLDCSVKRLFFDERFISSHAGILHILERAVKNCMTPTCGVDNLVKLGAASYPRLLVSRVENSLNDGDCVLECLYVT